MCCVIQDGRTALICAAQECRVEAVRCLVTQQEKPMPQLYMRDKHGFTALMYASMRDYQTIARLILSVPSRRMHERDRVRVCVFANHAVEKLKNATISPTATHA